MKIFLLSIALSFSSLLTCAQPYNPILSGGSNTWYYTINQLPVKVSAPSPDCIYTNWVWDSFEIGTVADTIIGGTTYKQLLQHSYNNPLDSCIIGYIREDSSAQQVFFVDNSFNPEILLYDFSLAVGDSILIDFVVPGSFYLNGYFHVDSINNITIKSGLRKAIHLSNKLAPLDVMTWIESVGFTGHITYTVSPNEMGYAFSWNCTDDFNRNFFYLLTCFEHSNQKVYYDSCTYHSVVNDPCYIKTDTCHYWNICGSLDDDGVFDEFIISPNPSNGNITIDIKSSFYSTGEFILRRGSGEVVKRIKIRAIETGHNRYLINNEDIAAGFYILEAFTDKGVDVRRVVIAH